MSGNGWSAGDGAARGRQMPRVEGGDGVGVQPGKGVRLQACPRCARPLSPYRATGARLCEICAAARRQLLRPRWASRRWT
jgi:hypothetical protein